MVILYENGDFLEITRELRKMRGNDGTSTAMRVAIMGYELGRVQEYGVKRVQKDLSPAVLAGLRADAKLAMADLLVMSRMLCLDVGWDFDEVQTTGFTHLKERFKDFYKEGFAIDNQV